MRRFSVLRVTFDWLTVILIMLAGSGVSISLFASTTTAQAAASEAPIATTLICTGNLLTNPSFENGVTGWSRLLVIPLLPAHLMLPMAATAPISIA